MNSLKSDAGSNLVDMGRSATHAEPEVGKATPKPVTGAGGEATRKACGVLVARLQGEKLGTNPVERCMVNVGTTSGSPSPPHSQCGGDGQVRCRLMASGWGGGSVVVRGRESRLHGEGTQRVSSDAVAMAGARR